jgi:hypothetical protein
MAPVGWHVTSRLEDDRVIAGTVAELREFARVVRKHGDPVGLLAFCCADTHAHVLFAGEREAVGEAIRRIEISLSRRHPGRPGFEAARIRPVHDQGHLVNAFRYVHRQHRHHGTGHDPGLDGCSVVDLLGARVMGARLVSNVRQHLPRTTREELARDAGVEVPPRFLSSPETPLPAFTLDQLVEATAAALGLPGLGGRGPRIRRAVSAAIAIADTVAPEFATAADISVRCVRAARRLPAEPALLAAIRTQLWLRALSARSDAASVLYAPPLESPALLAREGPAAVYAA